MDGRTRPYGWEQLDERTRAAIDEQLAKLPPLSACDPVRVRRLALLLGLDKRRQP